MKYLFLSLLFISSTAYASQDCSSLAEQVLEAKDVNTDVPEHLKGATIIIRQADGKESSVPAEKFKVVPRKQQFIVSKTLSMTVCSASEKNRVSVIGGYGTTGALKKNTKGLPAGKVTVDTKEGAVGGLQYQRKISDIISIGVQGQSNKTTSILIGLDF